MKKFFAAIILCLIATNSVWAQTLATYTGSGGTSTAVTANVANETVTSLATAGFGANTPCSSGGLSGMTVNVTFTSYSPSGPHVYFTVKPNSGYTLNLTGLTVGMRESGTGPTKARFAYSLDGGTTWTADASDHSLSPGGSCGSNTNYPWSGTLNVTGITSTLGVMIGVFPFSPGSSSGTFQVNSIVVNGAVVSGCTAPTLTATPTAASCNGQSNGSVALTTTGGSSPFTYAWTGPAGFNATTQNISGLAAGTYSVIVTATGGCTVATTAVVTQPAAINISAQATAPVCASGIVTLAANSTTNGVTYSWTGPNAFTSTLQSPVINAVQPNAQGVYSVTASVGGCTSAMATTTVTVNAIPTASITSSGADTFCSGNSVTLTGLTDIGTQFDWLYNGVDNGVMVNTVTAAASGSYQVIATSAQGCSDTSAVAVVLVNPLPTAQIAQSGPITICNGASTTLDANSGTSLTYVWTQDGNVINGATDASYDANVEGGYKVTVTDSNGCSSISSEVVVSVDIPTANITPAGPTTFCDGNNVVLNANAGASYQWMNNGVQIVGATDASFTATAAGSYEVQVSDIGNCNATSTDAVIVVNALPAAQATPQGPTGFCQGGSVELNANNGAGFTYQWYEGNNAIPGATGINYVANNADFYSVVVTDGNNCSNSSAQIPISVYALPVAAITPTGAITTCDNAPISLNANPGVNYTYQWYESNNAISGATDEAYSVTGSGSYSFVVMTGNNCADTSDTVNITVNPTPTISATGPTTVCYGTTTGMQVNIGGANPSQIIYQWQKDGTGLAGATDDNYTTGIAGTYNCIVSLAGVCSDTTTDVEVIVHAAPAPQIIRLGNMLKTAINYSAYQWYKHNAAIPNATNPTYTVTQNDDYSVEVTDANGCSALSAVFNVSGLAVNNISTVGDVTMYPNPAADVLYIRCAEPVNYVLYSLDGKKVLAGDNAKEIDVRTLPAGSYFVRITDSNGVPVKTEKIVKE